MKFQVHRDGDGWHVWMPNIDFASLMESYATRRQAITAVQMMREAEEIAFALSFRCEDETTGGV